MAYGELKTKQKSRVKRAQRVRKKFGGHKRKTRLTVTRSCKHLQAQLIDVNGDTIAGTATFAKEFKGTEFNRKSRAAAKKIGERIAEMAKEKGVAEVTFDRGPYKYHGVIAEIADGARAAGLKL